MTNKLRLSTRSTKTGHEYLSISFNRDIVKMSGMSRDDNIFYSIVDDVLTLSMEEFDNSSYKKPHHQSQSGQMMLNLNSNNLPTDINVEAESELCEFTVNDQGQIVLEIPSSLLRKEKGFHLLSGVRKGFGKLKAV